MRNTPTLHALGHSPWLDSVAREILDGCTLARYIDHNSIGGLTSNPTIFDEALGKTNACDAEIETKAKRGKQGAALFVELCTGRPAPGRGSLSPDLRGNRRRRWLGVAAGRDPHMSSVEGPRARICELTSEGERAGGAFRKR